MRIKADRDKKEKTVEYRIEIEEDAKKEDIAIVRGGLTADNVSSVGEVDLKVDHPNRPPVLGGSSGGAALLGASALGHCGTVLAEGQAMQGRCGWVGAGLPARMGARWRRTSGRPEWSVSSLLVNTTSSRYDLITDITDTRTG